MGLTKIAYTKSWIDAEDFPTVETDEEQVRKDMQELPNQIKDGVNNLIDELDTKFSGIDASLGGKSEKAIAFTKELSTNWENNTQTIKNESRFLASGYSYIVSPASSSFESWAGSMIYADDVTTNGQMTFHCGTAPTSNITVNILRVEV